VTYKTENPNATDYLYRIEVKLPEENKLFDTEMRKFLVPYIFSRDIAAKSSPLDKHPVNAHLPAALEEEDFTND